MRTSLHVRSGKQARIWLFCLAFAWLGAEMALGQADLPTSYSGPWIGAELPDGWEASGVIGTEDLDGMDGAAGFNSPGDSISIHFTEIPDTISYLLKDDGLSVDHEFWVQESADGIHWRVLALYNGNPANTNTAIRYTNSLQSISRHVKFVVLSFTETGQMILDGVVVSATNFTVRVDRREGFAVREKTEAVVTATGVRGAAPYSYEWETTLGAGEYSVNGAVLTVSTSASLGSYSATVTVTDSSAVPQTVDKTIPFTVERLYDIHIAPSTNGVVTTEPAEFAIRDERVVITATPDPGYEVGAVSVVDTNGALLRGVGNTFAMPTGSVMVAASFVAVSDEMRVRIATFNLLDGMEAASTGRYAATKAILQRMDADVVAFQRLTYETSNDWGAAAAELGYSNRIIARPGPFPGQYVGFYSRYPIVTAHHIASPPGTAELTRLPLRITVDVPGAAKPLAIWTMHHKAFQDNTSCFRRAVEALRINQDMVDYRLRIPMSDEFVFLGNMNDDVDRTNQVVSFTNSPTGFPDSYALGADVAFPVAYKVFPTDRYGNAGGGLQMVEAYQQGTTESTTYPSYTSRIDYVFASTALCAGTWGAITAEVYNSACDLGTGGLAKAGLPLPPETSAAASEHLPIFADLFLAKAANANLELQPTTVQSFVGVDGMLFEPSQVVFTLSNVSTGYIAWSATPSEIWFQVAPTNGILPAGESTNLVISMASPALALVPGRHIGALLVADLDGMRMSYGHIEIDVPTWPALSVDSEPLAFSGIRGEPYDPAGVACTISNRGDFPLSWRVDSTGSWLTFTPSNGVLEAWESANILAQVNEDAHALASGFHLASNSIINLSNGLGDTNNTALLQVFDGATIHVSAENGSDANSGTSWEQPKQTIQVGIDAATETIWVSNGVYDVGGRLSPDGGARVVIDRPLAVRSANGPSNTFIVGGLLETTDVRCAWMGEGSLLEGFTLTNGWVGTSGQGGGVFASSTSVLSNCVITGCSAGYGGGTYRGILYNCVLSSNSASNLGGGAYYGTLYGCTVSGNFSAGDGGGSHDGVLHNCMLTGNSASEMGGGSTRDKLYNCTVTSNSAGSGGGAFFGDLYGCLLSRNSASNWGGAAYMCELYNCFLEGNMARVAGGTYFSRLNNCTIVGNVATASEGGTRIGFLTNCINYFNNAPTNANYSGGTISYSCTDPPTNNMTGNISADPLFVDAAGGDYRLNAGSPCIDAGYNANIPAGPDLAGLPRPLDGNADGVATVDMGAYEFLNELADTDGDGMTDGAERMADTDPALAGSRLAFLGLASSDGQIDLNWMGGMRATQIWSDALIFPQTPGAGKWFLQTSRRLPPIRP